jgi:hypothetical protein
MQISFTVSGSKYPRKSLVFLARQGDLDEVGGWK